MTHIVREALDEYLNKPEIAVKKTPSEDHNKGEVKMSKQNHYQTEDA